MFIYVNMTMIRRLEYHSKQFLKTLPSSVTTVTCSFPAVTKQLNRQDWGNMSVIQLQ